MVLTSYYSSSADATTGSAVTTCSKDLYYITAADVSSSGDHSTYIISDSSNNTCYSTGHNTSINNKIIYHSYSDNKIYKIKASSLSGTYLTYTCDTASTITIPYLHMPILPSEKDLKKDLKKETLRNRIRQQLTPDIRPENEHLLRCSNDPAELKARGLLREMIGMKAYRDYLRRGFITVRGKSGLHYRIFGGTRHMTSYAKHDDGKFYPHEDICVVFCDHNLPLTDGVVMRLLLVENDEFALRRIANVRAMRPQTTSKPIVGLVA